MNIHTALLAILADPKILLAMVAASVFGVVLGAIPGLTAALGVALFVPFALFLDPVPAIAAIVCISMGAIFAGDIPGAFLGIPGTPASAAYYEDMSLIYRSSGSLSPLFISLIVSVLGGIFGVAILIAAAPALAEVAVQFSSYEYFWLCMIGLLCSVAAANDSVVRSSVSLFAGLGIGAVGMDPVWGLRRLDLGYVELSGGFGLIPVMVGMFALSQFLVFDPAADTALPAGRSGRSTRPLADFAHALATVARRWTSAIRGSIIGAVVGVLPGAGADIAAYLGRMANTLSGGRSQSREEFAKGNIVAASSANNASVCAAYVPALVFGIPGDGLTAIALGVLIMKGIMPSPQIFTAQESMMSLVFASFIVANIILLVVGTLAIGGFQYVSRVSKRQIMIIVFFMCIIGAYAIDPRAIVILFILIFAIMGIAFNYLGVPIAPAILGMVLGPILEQSLINSLIKSDGNAMDFVSRPVSAVLSIIFVLAVLAIALKAWRFTALQQEYKS